MGRGLGEYMVRHGLKYAGLICHGEQNFFATKQRDGAAEQVLTEEYPEIRVCGKVNFLTEVDVYQKTRKLIGMYPEIQALYVSWDGPALEVIKALTELERTDIAIVTGDLDYAIAMQMAQGGMVKMISAQCPYEQGEAIAMVAANGLLGKAVPSFIGVEPISIDRENLLKNWKAISRRIRRRRCATRSTAASAHFNGGSPRSNRPTEYQADKHLEAGLSAFYIAPAQAGFPKFFIAPIPSRLFGRVFFLAR